MDGTGPSVVAYNVRRIAHLDIPGGGQVITDGDYAYVGHIDPPAGTSIIDISDVTRPRVAAALEMPFHTHSHKVRVAKGVMVVNQENYTRHMKIAGNRLPGMAERLQGELGRAPTDAELAVALGNYEAADIPRLREAANFQVTGGGIRVYDVNDPTSPRELSFFPTGGNGVHRFDFDGDYAYLSTHYPGYHGYIVVIVDLRDPAKPEEVSRWWLKGQWLEGGEKPDWGTLRYECHHPLRFGDRLYVSYCHAGLVILDISDIANPRVVSHHNYHPPFFKTHTYTRVPFALAGRDVAVVVDEQPPRPRPGEIPAFMWVFDVTDETAPAALSAYAMSEEDTPCKRGPLGYSARFGAHQCNERLHDSLVHVVWFRGGLRIVDIKDPLKPEEVGWFIPAPGPGQATVQSNDVFVREDGLIFLIDRLNGLDILEYTGPRGVKP
jgi:hypothetical protein